MITLSSGNLYYSQQELNDAKTKINILVDELKKDFDSVSIALRDEALERGWCDAYNDFVDNVNTALVHMKLLPAKVDYEVKVKIEQTREQYVYITVQAASEEDALEEVGEWDYSDLLDNADDYDWEVTDFDTDTVRATKA